MSTNPAIYDAMALRGEDQAFSQDDPEAPIEVRDQSGGVQMVDPTAIAAEGMAMAARHMKENGPFRPMHSLADQERGQDSNKMTKAQLKEQVMNEEKGYPSNLGEANQVKALENRVAGIETGINQILSRLGGQSSQPSQPSSVSTGGSPASPVVPPTPSPVPTETSSPPSPKTIALPESNEPESRQPKPRQVTLKDGRKITVPGPASPLSLGPAVGVQEQPPTQLEVENFDSSTNSAHIEGVDLSDPKWNDSPDDWDDPIAVIPEEDQVEAPAPDPKLAQVVNLVREVNGFMQTNDVHRFWRRHISNSLHRHLGYNGWPKDLQADFDQRFQGFLRDPQFVTLACKKIISMELGHALGVKHVVAFLTAMAGFTAFALSGID